MDLSGAVITVSADCGQGVSRFTPFGRFLDFSFPSNGKKNVTIWRDLFRPNTELRRLNDRPTDRLTVHTFLEIVVSK